jgi:Ca2+-dependent lipid-binding protein
MTKIIVDVIEARNLKVCKGLNGKIDPYLQLFVGSPSHSNIQNTKSHELKPTKTIEFGEYFEFNVNEEDCLNVRLYDDKDLVDGEGTGEARIPLDEILDNGSQKCWHKLGDGGDYCGEVLLNIHTQ